MCKHKKSLELSSRLSLTSNCTYKDRVKTTLFDLLEQEQLR